MPIDVLRNCIIPLDGLPHDGRIEASRVAWIPLPSLDPYTRRFPPFTILKPMLGRLLKLERKPEPPSA
jgi:hypothetical protein